MAGSKTRFGFQGGSDPPDHEESPAARTVFGHDIHLQLPPGFSPPRPPGSPAPVPPPAADRPAAPAARGVVPEPGAVTPASTERRLRPRPSRLARFLGRWTRSGRFQATSRMGMEVDRVTGDDDDIEVPRDTTGRNVLLVVLVALLAFGITFAIVKLRYRLDAPVPAPPAPATAQPVPPAMQPAAPPPSPIPVAGAAPPAAPAPAGAASTAAAPAPLPPGPAAGPVDPAAKGLGAPVPAARKPPPKGAYRAEPPMHLKGELLPIGP